MVLRQIKEVLQTDAQLDREQFLNPYKLSGV